MEILRRAYYFLLFSNLLISIAAIAQCALTYIILGQSTNGYILVLEGGSTLLLYNFSMILSRPKIPQNSPYLRTRWIFANESLLWLNCILAIMAGVFALFHVQMYTVLFLLAIGVLSAIYSLPIFKVKGVRGGLRQLSGFKLFHIAIIWSLSSVGLPVVELWAQGSDIDWLLANYLGVLKIIFLIICTLPFDIRDMKQDKLYQLKTIPHIIGKGNAINLCYSLISFHTLLVCVAPYNWTIKIGLILTNLAIVLAMRFVIFKYIKEYHYVYLLDFALLLQFVFVVLLS